MTSKQARTLLVVHDVGSVDPKAVVRPTVAMVVSDVAMDPDLLQLAIARFFDIGCRFVMSWGKAANDVHDAIDDLVESLGGDYLSVATTAHGDEPAEEVAWFFINSAMPGEAGVRYVVFVNGDVDGADELLEQIKWCSELPIDMRAASEGLQ